MSWIVLLVIFVLVIVAAFAAVKGKQSGRGSVGFPYQSTKHLFSPAERSFLGVLDQAVGSEFRVFGKVRVADLAKVKPGLGNSARQGALNKIAAKHFDFVVCRASDLSVVCAVELNDSSHANQRARVRDEFVANVCGAIALPLLAVPAKQAYLVQELRAQFLATASAVPEAASVGT